MRKLFIAIATVTATRNGGYQMTAILMILVISLAIQVRVSN
jgi:hypothetical protein